MGQKSSKQSISQKLLQKSSRDVRLLVPDDKGEIHTVVVPKAVLFEHSGAFRELAEGGKLKKIKKLKLDGVHLIGVLRLMQYIEDGNVAFENVTEVAETLTVAEKYKIDDIEDVCIEYLGVSLNSDNVCEIYELCVKKGFTDVIYKCLKVIDTDTEEVLRSKSFLNLEINSVQDILKRHSLNISKESTIFNAMVKWAEAGLSKTGLDASNTGELKRLLRPLLTHIRFQNISPDDLETPEMIEMQLSLQQLKLSTESNVQPTQERYYTEFYVHHFEIFETSPHSITNGENFCLTIEILKGKVYFCGVNLALRQFSTRMNAACLYAMLCGTNKRTLEEKKVRGTFLNMAEESTLTFSSPLYVKDNDILHLELKVKMAGNVSPLTRKNDVEIIVPNNKDIAMKILPQDSTQNNVRCIFKDLIYFF